VWYNSQDENALPVFPNLSPNLIFETESRFIVSDTLASLRQRISARLTQAFVALWLASSIVLSIGLAGNNAPVQIVGAILGVMYVLVLIWWFARARPHAADMPDCEPIVTFPPSYMGMLASILVLSVALIGLTCIVLGDGWQMLLLSILISLIMIVIWRKRLTRRFIAGAIVTAIVFAIVEQLLGPDMGSGLILPIGAALMFLAGVVLLEHTHLTRIRLLDGDYIQAGKSFLWGCVLALPPALFNVLILRSAPPSELDSLFDRWWEPLYALQPGILEEIWARLLLTTLLYALLRPRSNDRPGRALFWAMAIAAFIHGAAHYPSSITTPLIAIYIALMYGIPLVLLYVKRDLEHAIAYHFFVDLLRFAAAVIANAVP
jgi:hypothetical protein